MQPEALGIEYSPIFQTWRLKETAVFYSLSLSTSRMLGTDILRNLCALEVKIELSEPKILKGTEFFSTEGHEKSLKPWGLHVPHLLAMSQPPSSLKVMSL